MSKESEKKLLQSLAAALGKEMEEHLGYAKHSHEGRGTGNRYNGTSKKTLKGQIGEVEIATPRDRQGGFSPQVIKRGGPV